MFNLVKTVGHIKFRDAQLFKDNQMLTNIIFDNYPKEILSINYYAYSEVNKQFGLIS